MDPRPQTYIADAAALDRCAAVVAQSPRVGLDTESNGFHAYFEKVCLVQLSTEHEDFAIDPLAVGLGALAPLLSDPAREVILHAAEFDVLTLRRDYGLRLGRIFDTHAAAKVLGIVRVGLGNLLEDQLAVKLTEDEQRSDWGKRPLSPSQISYAFADVRYLLTLRDHLGARLDEQGRGPEANAEFERVRMKEPRPRVFDPEGWQRMKVARTLDGKGRSVLRALYLLRDARARELDRPAFKVLSDLFMAEVARRHPKTEEALLAIPGASAQQLRKLAPQLLAAVADGLASPPPGKPAAQPRRGPPWKRNGGQDPVLEARYEALRAWRKQRADARKVEVQVIAPNAVLLNIAKAEPGTRDALAKVEGMDAFRVEQYGDELVAVLAHHAARASAPAARQVDPRESPRREESAEPLDAGEPSGEAEGDREASAGEAPLEAIGSLAPASIALHEAPPPPAEHKVAVQGKLFE